MHDAQRPRQRWKALLRSPGAVMRPRRPASIACLDLRTVDSLQEQSMPALVSRPGFASRTPIRGLEPTLHPANQRVRSICQRCLSASRKIALVRASPLLVYRGHDKACRAPNKNASPEGLARWKLRFYARERTVSRTPSPSFTGAVGSIFAAGLSATAGRDTWSASLIIFT